MTTTEKIKTLFEMYFEWLLATVSVKNVSYRLAAHVIHTIIFGWDTNVAPNDVNRAEDARELRVRFLEHVQKEKRLEMGVWEEFMRQDVTMFEVLVALSRRLDDIMGHPGHPDSAIWFYNILKNLGLDKLDDKHWMGDFDAHNVRTKLEKVVNRDYNKSGYGSLFPLARNYRNVDMRETEIWYQMQAWLEENYS